MKLTLPGNRPKTQTEIEELNKEKEEKFLKLIGDQVIFTIQEIVRKNNPEKELKLVLLPEGKYGKKLTKFTHDAINSLKKEYEIKFLKDELTEEQGKALGDEIGAALYNYEGIIAKREQKGKFLGLVDSTIGLTSVRILVENSPKIQGYLKSNSHFYSENIELSKDQNARNISVEGLDELKIIPKQFLIEKTTIGGTLSRLLTLKRGIVNGNLPDLLTLKDLAEEIEFNKSDLSHRERVMRSNIKDNIGLADLEFYDTLKEYNLVERERFFKANQQILVDTLDKGRESAKRAALNEAKVSNDSIEERAPIIEEIKPNNPTVNTETLVDSAIIAGEKEVGAEQMAEEPKAGHAAALEAVRKEEQAENAITPPADSKVAALDAERQGEPANAIKPPAESHVATVTANQGGGKKSQKRR